MHVVMCERVKRAVNDLFPGHFGTLPFGASTASGHAMRYPTIDQAMADFSEYVVETRVGSQVYSEGRRSVTGKPSPSQERHRALVLCPQSLCRVAHAADQLRRRRR